MKAFCRDPWHQALSLREERCPSCGGEWRGVGPLGGPARLLVVPLELGRSLWDALWVPGPDAPPPRSWGAKEAIALYVAHQVVAGLVTYSLWKGAGVPAREFRASSAYPAGHVVSTVVALLFVSWLLRRRGVGWNDLGFRSFDVRQALRYLAAGVAASTVLTSCVVGVVALVSGIDAEEPHHPDVVAAIDRGGSGASLAAAEAIVLGPAFEEVSWRGLLFSGLLKHGAGRAALLSSLVFGLGHGQANAVLGAFIFGLAACALFWKLGSLWPALILHSAVNALWILN